MAQNHDVIRKHIEANDRRITKDAISEATNDRPDDLAIMQGLTEAYSVVRKAQFGMASAAPVVWDMMQRILKYLDQQQKDALAAIRS